MNVAQSQEASLLAPALRKFQLLVRLQPEEVEALEHMLSRYARHLGQHDDLVSEGSPLQFVRIILSGWAYRYKMLEDGRRQILAFLLPGDFCDPNYFCLGHFDHSIGSITALSYAMVPATVYQQLLHDHPRIARVATVDTLLDLSIQREWTLNLGQRDAYERIAHLLCELYIRLHAIGLAENGKCAFPLTQSDLAEATGLSTVHVNRTLQALRAAGLITLTAKTLTIANLQALESTALFTSDYLHWDVGTSLTRNSSGPADGGGEGMIEAR
jgi:CRP-like cAMP-binding protein